MNPHEIAPLGVTVHEAQDEEITQLHEAEHIKLQESIQQRNLRLRELENDQVWLRKKIILKAQRSKGWKTRSREHVSSINQGWQGKVQVIILMN